MNDADDGGTRRHGRICWRRRRQGVRGVDYQGAAAVAGANGGAIFGIVSADLLVSQPKGFLLPLLEILGLDAAQQLEINIAGREIENFSS